MKQTLELLIGGGTLTRDEARDTLVTVSNGGYSDAEVAAFTMALSMRRVALEELEGFREALLSLCIPVVLDGIPAIDLCGTGGDGKDTFNISTLAALVVAAAGQSVLKHGNYGVTSHCGSSNVLEALGIQFPRNADEVLQDLDACGIAFVHAPLFHPAMKGAAPVRRSLGIRTFFNLLGPLVNPGNPPYQSTGVCNLEIHRLYSCLLQRSEVTDYRVCHALDGYDEVSLTGAFRVTGRSADALYYPVDFDMDPVAPESLSGGKSIKEAAAIFLEILSGEGTIQQQSAVIINAAIALSVISGSDPGKEIELAREALTSGRARQIFVKLIEQGKKRNVG